MMKALVKAFQEASGNKAGDPTAMGSTKVAETMDRYETWLRKVHAMIKAFKFVDPSLLSPEHLKLLRDKWQRRRAQQPRVIKFGAEAPFSTGVEEEVLVHEGCSLYEFNQGLDAVMLVLLELESGIGLGAAVHGEMASMEDVTDWYMSQCTSEVVRVAALVFLSPGAMMKRRMVPGGGKGAMEPRPSSPIPCGTAVDMKASKKELMTALRNEEVPLCPPFALRSLYVSIARIVWCQGGARELGSHAPPAQYTRKGLFVSRMWGPHRKRRRAQGETPMVRSLPILRKRVWRGFDAVLMVLWESECSKLLMADRRVWPEKAHGCRDRGV